MTNNEAAKWIQLYIDLAKFDPTTGEAAYLNEDAKKTIEAMEMAISALTAQPETHGKRTETHACDCINCSEIPNNSDAISRQAAIDALDKRFDSIPMEQTTEILLLRKDLRELPSAQPELIEKTAYIRGFEQGRTQGMIDAKVEKLGSSAQPEIVHCKDCKHYIKSESYCDYFGITISDHDFCSFAERKINE